MRNPARAAVFGVILLAVVGGGCRSKFRSGDYKMHIDPQSFLDYLAKWDQAALEQPNSAEGQVWRARARGKLNRDEETVTALHKAAALDTTGIFRLDIQNTRLSF